MMKNLVWLFQKKARTIIPTHIWGQTIYEISLSYGFDYSTESQYDDRYVNLSITHITNSSDYYLCGTYYFGEDIQTIKDTSDSDIKFIPIGVINSKQSSKVYKSYLIYGTINSYTKNYSLEINNQTIVFN